MQIHELNNFVGALGASAYLPVDNGQDTGKLAFTDLFVGDSFTTLWSGNSRCNEGNEFSLSKPITDFEFLDIYYQNGSSALPGTAINSYLRVPTSMVSIGLQAPYFEDAALFIYEARLTVATNKLTVASTARWDWTGASSDAASYNSGTASQIWITRIDGIATPGNSKGVIETNTVTLAAADWSDNSQTVTLADLRATDNVIISPDPANYSDYADAGVHCSAVGTNSLTFVCDTTPSTDLLVNVMVVG